MKVLLIGNYVRDNQYSMLGFANAMHSGLKSAGVEARLIDPRTIVGKFGHPANGIGKWLGYADKFVFFPNDLRRALSWADIVHVCDHGNAMYVKHLNKKPHVVTCHDVLAIRSAMGDLQTWSTGYTGRIFQRNILSGLQQARLVACVSDATRQELLRVSHRNADHTAIVYNGLYSHYEPMSGDDSLAVIERLKRNVPERFILHVGGNQPYKNRIGVLRIFDQLRQAAPWRELHLVMAGRPFTEGMRAVISECNLGDSVTELVALSNEELRALYSRALALIFPSLYEGFGVPIVEAQACGCPVFTSNRAPMTEVGGNAAVYFDPEDPQSAARTIAEKLGDTRGLTAEGYINCKRFTTERMIEDYIALYRQALSGKPGQTAVLSKL